MELDIKPFKNLNDTSPNRINLYRTVPFGQLTLEECEDLFRQRIEALHLFEKTHDYGEDKSLIVTNGIKEIKSHVFKTNCLKHQIHDKEQHKYDHFSHMLARMYCVYNANLWDWFRNNERKLLYHRLRRDYNPTSDQLESILTNFNFEFKRVRLDELIELKRENIIGWNSKDNNHEEVFKVHFTKALKFIARRSVALKDGYAFLTRGEILSIVCDVFEKHLDHELEYARQHLNLDHLQTQQLLESLDMVYADYLDKISDERKKMKRDNEGENHNPYRIDIDELGDTVNQHFPPCIRYLHESLIQDHHLKHTGRLIYGTFLKSGGVDMDRAIEFWRREFTKKIPNDKFERDYKYNIRHLYGREGQKKSLSCFSCDKIINDNPPGPSEKHGCPFKHFDETHLKGMLNKHEIKSVDIESIITHVNNKDYKLACSHYFKFSKGEFPTEQIKNPIHFYFESKRLANRPKQEEDTAQEEEEEEVNNDTCAVKPQNGSCVDEPKDSYADEEMTDDL